MHGSSAGRIVEPFPGSSAAMGVEMLPGFSKAIGAESLLGEAGLLVWARSRGGGGAGDSDAGGANALMTSTDEAGWNGVNFLRCFLLRKVTLPDPSTFTTYW